MQRRSEASGEHGRRNTDADGRRRTDDIARVRLDQVTVDRRLKAAVGYIPFFGEPFLPAFGRDQHGLDGVTLPYLAISGTADTTAPLVVTEQGIERLTGRGSSSSWSA